MPKSYEARSHEHMIVDRVAELRHELDVKVEEKYRLLRPGNEPGLIHYQTDRAHPFRSVDLRNRKFASRVLAISLERGSDPDDYAYCSHAEGGHRVFHEVAQRLIFHLEEGNATFEESPVTYELPNLHESRMLPNIRVIGPYENIQINLPGPHALAVELKGKTGTDDLRLMRELRRAASEETPAFIVLTCMYLGMDTAKITRVLSDEHLRKRLREKDPGAFLPHETDDRTHSGRAERGRRMLNGLLSLLASQNRDFTFISDMPTYNTAVQILRNEYSFKLTEREQNPRIVQKRLASLAVFRGMVQIAFKSAPPEYRDPDLTRYIYDNYDNKTSTELVTAYFEDPGQRKRISVLH